MSKHICGYQPQRGMLIAIAAAASMLLAVSGPVATADTGTGSKNHTQTGGGETGTNKVTSTVKQAVSGPPGSAGATGSPTNGTQVRSGSQSTMLHNNSALTAGPSAPDPGVNFGSGNAGSSGNVGGQGNTNFGHNTDPVQNKVVNTLTGAGGGVNGQQPGNASALTGAVANRNAGTPNLGNGNIGNNDPGSGNAGASGTAGASGNAGSGNQVNSIFGSSANTGIGADDTSPASDTDFMSSPTISLFGLFSNTSFADPDDNQFVATVFSSPLFTDTLTSGVDPSRGLGTAGETVNTLNSPVFPFLNSTLAIPVTDPLAALFTLLLPFGF
jgi:hypothetical protein